ncbi:exported hypothetical protein [Candidatus Sulfotelmatobacter kueseliae]|uniref:Uncharacterized protein n=1 Tax=Candidatus Sulfotelmatobacter kueseliae TaxID=2042962 RepID=A0A2U3KR91_9BACT|nr:exported hypothetical protein [Candidatus Sulfotelmatobacter kueseliae]
MTATYVVDYWGKTVPFRQPIVIRPHPRSLSITALLVTLCALASAAFSQNVLAYHNHNSRTGLNHEETILTLSSVNFSTFDKCSRSPSTAALTS